MNRSLVLTSAGLQNPRVGQAFVELLKTPVATAKLLFVPTAAIWPEALRMLAKCIDEIYGIGITSERISVYNLDRPMASDELRPFDAIYFAGGSSNYLLERANLMGFAPIVRQFVAQGGVFLGASAGSIFAADIGLVNCRFTGLHIQDGSPNGPVDLSACPEIRLTDNQALVVNSICAVVLE
jgi:peptidase E